MLSDNAAIHIHHIVIWLSKWEARHIIETITEETSKYVPKLTERLRIIDAGMTVLENINLGDKSLATTRKSLETYSAIIVKWGQMPQFFFSSCKMYNKAKNNKLSSRNH